MRMYNFETHIAIIALLIVYPIFFVTRDKVLAAKETEAEYARRSKGNNIAVVLFSVLLICAVLYNATFY